MKTIVHTPSIRPATERDARDIAEIVRESYRRLPLAHAPAEMPIFHEEHIRQQMADPETRWVLLIEQGRRLGLAMWRAYPAVAHLSMLFVRSDFQGKGYGAALLRHFEHEAASVSDLRLLTLHCL